MVVVSHPMTVLRRHQSLFFSGCKEPSFCVTWARFGYAQLNPFFRQLGVDLFT
jgi:hypothetical protein